MSAKYIVRFDDICPTMNWVIWEQIESILVKHNIKPILAVVPDNRDPKLVGGPQREDFWERVRAWQAAGWFIAIHGYQHLYSTPESGLMRINNRSEFAGLSYEEQRSKLEKGLAIFAQHNVCADAWIAPAHAFDTNTVKALLDLNINIISDGYYWRPVKRLDALWVPQQLWRFRKMPFGLWTVCLHHNGYSEKDLKKLELNIEEFASSITSFDQAIRDYSASEINVLDKAMEKYWQYVLRFKTKLWPITIQIKRLLQK
jgi:predicted deacetylase